MPFPSMWRAVAHALLVIRQYYREQRERRGLEALLNADRHAAERLGEAQRGAPPQMTGQWVERADQWAEERFRSTKVVDDDHRPAGFTDTVDLSHHPYRIGHHTDDMERGHIVERTVRKIEVE